MVPTLSADVYQTLTMVLFIAEVSYNVEYLGAVDNATATCSVSLSDKEGKVVASGNACAGKLAVASPTLWWPYLMHPAPGYLYSLKVTLETDTRKPDLSLRISHSRLNCQQQA